MRTDEVKIDELLARDAGEIAAETQRAIESGIAQRMTIAAPQQRPNAMWQFAAVAAALVLIAGVVALHVTGRKGRQTIAVVWRQAPAPATASDQRSSIAQGHAVVPAEHADAKVRAVVAHARRRAGQVAQRRGPEMPVFPAPAPLTAEEKTLTLLARADPARLDELYRQQQLMKAEYEQRDEEFARQLHAQRSGDQGKGDLQ